MNFYKLKKIIGKDVKCIAILTESEKEFVSGGGDCNIIIWDLDNGN